MRCLAAPTSSARSLELPGARLRLEGSVLNIEGLRQPTRIAAFGGPAFYAPLGPAELAAVRRADADLVLVLGDFGDDLASASATLTALASLPQPSLILAGGRDALERTAKALEGVGPGRDRVFDLTPLDRVLIGAEVLLPLAGAHEGHYAAKPDGCGYSQTDLAARSAAMRGLAPGSHTHVVAWEQPQGWPAGDALDPGATATDSSEFGELARVASGIFAWPPSPEPSEQAPLQPGQTLGVPRLTGPPVDLADGSRRAPGLALLQLDASGLTPIDPGTPR